MLGVLKRLYMLSWPVAFLTCVVTSCAGPSGPSWALKTCAASALWAVMPLIAAAAYWVGTGKWPEWSQP